MPDIMPDVLCCSTADCTPVVVVLSLFELIDVASLQQELLFLHNEQRATDPPGVRVNADLSLSDITDHRHLSGKRS